MWDLCFDQLPRVLGCTSTSPSLAGNSRRLDLVLRVQIWANAQEKTILERDWPHVGWGAEMTCQGHPLRVEELTPPC